MQFNLKRAQSAWNACDGQRMRVPCGKVTACPAVLQQRVGQEVEGPLTNLTGRHVHTSSQQISQRAVFCHLLLDREKED